MKKYILVEEGDELIVVNSKTNLGTLRIELEGERLHVDTTYAESNEYYIIKSINQDDLLCYEALDNLEQRIIKLKLPEEIRKKYLDVYNYIEKKANPTAGIDYKGEKTFQYIINCKK